MVKSVEEIRRLTKAAQVNEYASRESISAIKVGSSAGEVKRIYMESVTRNGGAPALFLYSKHGLSITDDPSYRFRNGDTIYIDFNCTYDMYYADTGYTVVIGEPTSDSLRIYETLRGAISAALQSVRPGVPSSIPGNTMSAFLEQRGIAPLNAQGHGIGLEPKEYPAIRRSGSHAKEEFSDGIVTMSKDILLEKGMVLNLEVPYFRFGAGSFQIEKTMLVTESGVSPLISQDREAPLIL
jgi:Xaa-Pro aminopeptidase